MVRSIFSVASPRGLTILEWDSIGNLLATKGDTVSDSADTLARRFFEEIWNQKRGESLEQFAHAEAISHRSSDEIKGSAEFLDSIYLPFTKAIPDLHIEIEAVLAQGDEAVVRWRTTGTHTEEGLGVPASGQRINFQGMTWLTFRDGKVIEGWDCWDEMALMQQLKTPVAG